MSASNNQQPQSLYYKFDVDQEEFQAKIDSLLEMIEDDFTKKDYEIDFQLTYSKCHEICINRMAKELYKAVVQLISKIVLTYQENLIASSDDAPNYDFLNKFVNLFNFFSTKIGHINDVLSYMERIKQRFNFKEEPIIIKANQIFYQTIVLNENIKTKILNTVKREYGLLRNNNESNREIFSQFFAIIIDKQYNSTFYTTELLPLILEQTKEFYDNYQSSFVDQITHFQGNKENIIKCIKDHFINVEKIFEKEEKILKDIDEKEEILSIIFEKLIMKNFDMIFKMGVKKFFKSTPDISSLKTIYGIIFNHKIQNLEEHINQFYKFFNDMLVKKLKKLSDTFVTVKNNHSEYFNFFQYIDEIFTLKVNLTNCLTKSFNNNPKIEHIIKSLFEKKINQRTDFLLNFVKLVHEEIKLCQKIRSNKRIKEFNEKFLCIFKLINDKDLFELEYRKYLSRRLIRNSQMIKELEMDFYRIMKKESGTQYVKKIENMLNDILISQDINIDFRIKNKLNKNELGLDFYIKVLSQENWPIDSNVAINIPNEKNAPKQVKKIPFNLPLPLDKCIQDFSVYYYLKYTNRFIAFAPQLSWGELKMNLNKKKYSVIVSSYQICILMLFNSSPSYETESISKITNVPLNEIEEHVYPLMKNKILLYDKDKKIIKLNTDFDCDDCKINLNYKVKEKQNEAGQKEEKEVSHFILEDRKHQVDANIIHILKTNKKMKFEDLRLSLVNKVNEYFIPDVSLIKTRLENLMERNFIERDKENPEIYIYIA